MFSNYAHSLYEFYTRNKISNTNQTRISLNIYKYNMTPKQQITYHIASASVIPPYFLRSCSVSINFTPLPPISIRTGLNLPDNPDHKVIWV